RIYSVVLITQLKRALRGQDKFGRYPPLPGRVVGISDETGEDQYELDKILSRRVIWRAGKPDIKYLVKWNGYGSEKQSFS
ncbi:hypothetical protein QBC42DRAFT_179835, partial [Cladorrhinum samala]